jgi:SAM-dependent methyltransferase
MTEGELTMNATDLTQVAIEDAGADQIAEPGGKPKSTWETIMKFVETMEPGQWVERQVIVAYCEENGTTANRRTIDNTLKSMITNECRSGNVRALGPGTEWSARNDVLVMSSDRKMCRLYDPALDPKPIYHGKKKADSDDRITNQAGVDPIEVEAAPKGMFDKARHKCQTHDHSFTDSIFVTFSNSFAINFIKRYGEDLKRKPDVLDVGCHDGRLVRHLMNNRAYFKSYVGIDINPANIEICQQVARDGRKNCNFLLADFADPGFSIAEKFDVAVCLETIEHMTRLERQVAFANFGAAVKVGGLALIGCPYNTDDKIFHDDEQDLGHFELPTYREIVDGMATTGFSLDQFFHAYSLFSRYRIPESDKGLQYQRLRAHLGGNIARAVQMSLSESPTGGGHFVFKRIE